MAGRREEAGEELAVRGEPCTRAVVTERARHRRDDADLALPVLVAVPLGDL